MYINIRPAGSKILLANDNFECVYNIIILKTITANIFKNYQ